MARIVSGSAFHVFPPKKKANSGPFLVLLTLGKENVIFCILSLNQVSNRGEFLPLKTTTILINMAWTRQPFNLLYNSVQAD